MFHVTERSRQIWIVGCRIIFGITSVTKPPTKSLRSRSDPIYKSSAPRSLRQIVADLRTPCVFLWNNHTVAFRFSLPLSLKRARARKLIVDPNRNLFDSLQLLRFVVLSYVRNALVDGVIRQRTA